MQQMSLGGLEAPADDGIHRLFFALWPQPPERERMAAAARTLHDPGAGGRLVGAHRYHLTLQFLGDFPVRPDTLAGTAAEAARGVRAAPFALRLDTAGSFANRSIPWWLGCVQPDAGLETLWQTLGTALAHARIRVHSGRRLVPHVTVVRDARRRLETRSIEPIDWPVDAFVLIHSHLAARSAYTVLERFPLQAP